MIAITYTTNTREHHIRMARIYLHEARNTVHRANLLHAKSLKAAPHVALRHIKYCSRKPLCG